jgi:hypothetical protein
MFLSGSKLPSASAGPIFRDGRMTAIEAEEEHLFDAMEPFSDLLESGIAIRRKGFGRGGVFVGHRVGPYG